MRDLDRVMDRLRMDHINSLPQPFLARFCGDRDWWPVADFEVQTGLMRIDVVGKLQVMRFSEVMEIQDGNSVFHDPETFYTDWITDDLLAQISIEGRDRHNPKGPSRYAQAKKDEQAK